MEEKILIQSNNDYAKKLKKTAITLFVIGVIIFIVVAATTGLAAQLNTIRLPLFVISIILFLVGIILLIYSLMMGRTSITVSNKRVYGSTTFGKRVDLPLDSISAVGVSAFHGIAIGTSSGKISFKGIGNRDEIHDVISKLLVERQQKATSATTTIKQEIPQSNADELKKYKDLLDNGIISQEEFDAKKKQLLGL